MPPWPERLTRVEKLPPAGRSAASTIDSLPLKPCHTTTAPPTASIATCGDAVGEGNVPGSEETSIGAEKLPPAGRSAACTIERVGVGVTDSVPIKRSHTTTASPVAFIATCGARASWPGAERFTGDVKLPPAGRTAACTVLSVPL